MNLSTPLAQTRITVLKEIRHRARVLVVDDDEFFGGREEAVLNRAGYRTMGAADGEEAPALLRMGDFGLVLTDWHMPHLDGVGLIRALLAAGNRIPLIMISGSVTTAGELPGDVRGEITVALPKYADSGQILASVASALHEQLPPQAVAA
jgi:DNA-binding NtrC family response regulator